MIYILAGILSYWLTFGAFAVLDWYWTGAIMGFVAVVVVWTGLYWYATGKFWYGGEYDE